MRGHMPTPPNPNRYPHIIDEPYLGGELLPAFHRAFGCFINQFGQTETTLQFQLEEYATGLIGGGLGNSHDDLKHDVLRAFLGSKNSEAVVAAFRLCIKAWMNSGRSYSDASQLEIEALFSQLGAIRTLRNRTAHYGSHPVSEGGNILFRTVNRYTVNDIEKTEELLYRIEDLEACSDDLATICMRMPFALGMHKRRGNDPNNPEDLPPWKFRPSSIVRRPFQRRPINLEPQAPPKAWWD